MELPLAHATLTVDGHAVIRDGHLVTQGLLSPSQHGHVLGRATPIWTRQKVQDPHQPSSTER